MLRALTELVDRLLYAVADAGLDAERPEASMRLIGQHARGFLISIREAISNEQSD